MTGMACVIGSSGGIGSAVARQLAEQGWSTVIGMDRDTEISIDVSDSASIERAFEAARASAPRLDALIVCSGILDLGKLRDLTLARWEEVLRVNLTGPFLCCQAAREWIADGGRIVLVGSLAGRTGGVATGTAYSVSKGGVESLTKALAQELAPRGITVNCVAPGGVDTPMLAQNPSHMLEALRLATPLKRMATPDEVAAAIVFLTTPGASYITGAVVPVNGGIRMD